MTDKIVVEIRYLIGGCDFYICPVERKEEEEDEGEEEVEKKKKTHSTCGVCHSFKIRKVEICNIDFYWGKKDIFSHRRF